MHAHLATMIPLTTTSPFSAILFYLAVAVLEAPRKVQADPNAPCYFPGGEFAPGYFACQAFNAPVSSCCPAGWTCFSNALCIATTESNSFPNLTLGAVQRGACTNPQWNNNICGSACLDEENRKGELAACGNDRFCCASDFHSGKCDCSESDGPFTISAGLPQTIIQVTDTTFTGRSPSLSIASTRASGTTTKASATGTTTQTTDSPSSTSPGSSSPRSTTSTPSSTPAAPPVGSSSSPDDSASDSDSGGLSTGAKIGLGVGIPLAVLAVAGALAYFFWWRRRQERIERDRRIEQMNSDRYFQSTDLAENDPHGPMKYEPYRQQGGT